MSKLPKKFTERISANLKKYQRIADVQASLLDIDTLRTRFGPTLASSGQRINEG